MINYKDAGVDIVKGEQFVDRIKRFIKSTYNDSVVSGVGGFAALYDLGNGRYLASGTDGVGTKLKLAQQLQMHTTIGQDLVAMCVNDILCTGARPLFFLDYLATGKLDLAIHEGIVEGIANACRDCGCVLIGGETAEMPGMYQQGEYDLAGFAVGEVYKKDLITGQNIAKGDTLIGLASSGFHSNGYSLIRKLLDAEEKDFLQAALTPTKLYVNEVMALLHENRLWIKGLAHITGSGFLNIARINEKWGYDIVSPPQLKELPNVMQVVAKRAELDQQELARTFNMGIGLVIVTDSANEVLAKLNELGQKAFKIGEVTDEFCGVKLKGKLL